MRHRREEQRQGLHQFALVLRSVELAVSFREGSRKAQHHQALGMAELERGVLAQEGENRNAMLMNAGA